METRLPKRTRCCPKVKLPQNERQCGEYAGCEQRWGLVLLINTHAGWKRFFPSAFGGTGFTALWPDGGPSPRTRLSLLFPDCPQVSGPTEVKAAVCGHLARLESTEIPFSAMCLSETGINNMGIKLFNRGHRLWEGRCRWLEWRVWRGNKDTTEPVDCGHEASKPRGLL